MRLFGRKKEDEETVEPKVVKKKKKIPPKPWNKKDRLLVLLILVSTVLISAGLALNSRSWKLPGFSVPSLPTLSAPFFSEETIVIEGRKEWIEKGQKSEEVLLAFEDKTKNLSGVYSLYVIDLRDGFSYGSHENETFEPASLNKLPVMIAMYLEQENGNIDLDSKYVLKNSDKTSGTGSLDSKPEGYEITYRELLKIMGKDSDNTAFNIVKNLLGEEKINFAIEKVGMKNTDIFSRAQTTTPYDIGVLFQKLYEDKLLTESNKLELLGFLTDTAYEKWLAAGIPQDVVFSHKYGREANVVNDAGIVFYNDVPFVLVTLSKGIVYREADNMFPELGKLIYSYQTR